MKPEISIVMPVRNAERTLPAALRSLTRQSFTKFEVIAVDDHSDDGSLRLLETWSKRDRRIRVVPNAGKGIVAALNTGLGEAKGNLIARMDADDVSHPMRLKLQRDFLLKNAPVQAVGSRVRLFPRPRLKDGMLHYEGWLNSVLTGPEIVRDIFVESPFAHPSVMFTADSVKQIGGYRDLDWPEDYDLWLRMAKAGVGMAKLPQTLLYWRDGSERLSRRHGMYSPESFRRLKAHFLREWRLAGVRKVQLWGAGRDGKTWAKLLMKPSPLTPLPQVERGSERKGDTGFEVVQFIDIDKKKVGGRACGGIPVVWPADIIKGTPILCAVGIKGARGIIREYLCAEGFREPEEFFFLS